MYSWYRPDLTLVAGERERSLVYRPSLRQEVSPAHSSSWGARRPDPAQPPLPLTTDIHQPMDNNHLHQGAELSIVNHPAARISGSSLLHRLVRTAPDDGSCAIDYISFDGTRTALSYQELHASSDALARRILSVARRRGDEKHCVIPVLIPQSPALYIALLAILKAGAAFCPLNLDIPPERAKFILNDVSADIVLTSSDLVWKLPREDPERAILVVGDEDEIHQSGEDASGLGEPKPTDLAYVMYTSGSTGTPKGVGVSHLAATQSLLAHDRFIPQFSRFLQFAAPTFDVSVFEIFFPLFRGKTLVSCNRDRMLNDLPGMINLLDVDSCELTPTVAGSLLRKRESSPGLRLLLTIGEMLSQPVIQEFGGRDDLPSILWAMYGPTEAAIHCTLQPAVPSTTFNGDIGVPLDSVSAFILKIPDDEGSSIFRSYQEARSGNWPLGGTNLPMGT